MSSKLNYDGTVVCSVSVTDLDKALAWYGKVLGFEETFKVDEAGWAEMKTHMPKLFLGLSRVDKVEAKGGATVILGVKDVDAARAEMEEMSVKFQGETQVVPGMVKLATFSDPDGNTLMLAEDLS